MDSLKQFLSAERYMLSPRPGPASRERWHVTTGPDEVRILTTEEMDEALARLDADRHSWGEPGEVPADILAAFLAGRGDTSWMIWCSYRGDLPITGLVIRESSQMDIVFDDGNGNGLELIHPTKLTDWQFRRRWTPAPPTTTEETE